MTVAPVDTGGIGLPPPAVEPPEQTPEDRVEAVSAWFARASATWLRADVALIALIAAYVVVFGRLTWAQQTNFGTMDYDMGVFDQEIWLAAHHLNPYITIRGLNMWANHVNPIIYLLVPFYWLGAGPHFLFLVQTLAFGIAAVPLWLLARDRFGSPWLALAVPVAWFLYPAVEWMNYDQFHPEMLGIPAFLFAYWFADRHRWGWYALCVVLVLSVKEDAALPIIALGVVLLLRRHIRAGIVTIAGAVAWFLICIEVIVPAAIGGSAPFFLYQYASLGDSTGQILVNFVAHPSKFLGLVFNHARYRYYEQLFVPVAALAVLAPVTLLLVVPTLLENVTNNQGYPYDIRYQYGAFISAGIFLAVVEAIGRWRYTAIKVLLAGILVFCALGSNIVWSPSPLDKANYQSGIWSLQSSPLTRAVDSMVHRVPADAVVSATYSEVPHLSHRDRLYSWPNPWIRSYFGINATTPPLRPGPVKYLVIDKTELSPDSAHLLAKLTRPGGPFRVLADRKGALLAVRVRSGE